MNLDNFREQTYAKPQHGLRVKSVCKTWFVLPLVATQIKPLSCTPQIKPPSCVPQICSPKSNSYSTTPVAKAGSDQILETDRFQLPKITAELFYTQFISQSSHLSLILPSPRAPQHPHKHPSAEAAVPGNHTSWHQRLGVFGLQHPMG